MNLDEINALSHQSANAEFMRCCGSSKWTQAMCENRPYKTKEELIHSAENFWFKLESSDWLEAFTHHPNLGDTANLEEKYPETSDLSRAEQENIHQATRNQMNRLRQLNLDYEKKFGFIFISCAQGKSVVEILQELESRIVNNSKDEIRLAMIEQNKITKLRLIAKLEAII